MVRPLDFDEGDNNDDNEYDYDDDDDKKHIFLTLGSGRPLAGRALWDRRDNTLRTGILLTPRVGRVYTYNGYTSHALPRAFGARLENVKKHKNNKVP